MSDFRDTPDPQARGRSIRSQQEKKKAELLGDLSQSLDIQHHDTSLRHEFGKAFEIPTIVTPTDSTDEDGFVGTSDIPARMDHRHGFDSVPWTNIGSFSNSWGNLGGTDNSPAGYRRIGDIVYLRGVLASGTLGATMFTMPVGFRPTDFIRFAINSNNLFGALLVRPTGSVELDVGSNVFCDLSPVYYALV